MPPKVKITRDMIIDAAFDIIRNEGSENLNARNIAARLNCSTQPVLYSFKTVDEIREAVYRKADEYHTSFILPKETDIKTIIASAGEQYPARVQTPVVETLGIVAVGIVQRPCLASGQVHHP